MISEKRQNFTRINSKGLLTLQDLVDRTGCSASTIRRDLSKLQNMGKLQRVHGGADSSKSS